MLSLFADCLQLDFHYLPPDELAAVVWHHDVEGWAVWDNRSEHKGEFIGYLFADLLERPHKYRGNQSVNLQPGYLKPDGTRVYPANTLMCNFHLSSFNGYQLSHGNVATLFHELGHSMHDIVSHTRYARFHGYEVPLELGEGIGIMLEQWCWLPNVLQRLSRHYTRVDPAFKEGRQKDHPGEELPPEHVPGALVAQRIAQRSNSVHNTVSQHLIIALFDLAVHNPASREALLQLDAAAAHHNCSERIQFQRPPRDTWPQATEGILFSGYDEGFYAYICGRVLAVDIFQTTFAADPLSQAAWQKFRERIMEPGGSRDERLLVEEFLGGRQMNPAAMYSVLGISKTV